MNLKIVDQAKYLCAKTLSYHGFPTPPIKKHYAPREYCKNYPCLYTYDFSLDSIEFQESLKERNLEAKNLFSLSNPDLTISAIFIALSRFAYLLAFFGLLVYAFPNQQIFIRQRLILFFILGLFFYLVGRAFIGELRRNNIEIFCLLEAFYIYIDLSANNVLTNKKLSHSLVRRIKNLSKSIYISGQQKKYSTDSLKQYYSRISFDILNKINWIYSAQHSTLPDLRKYFNHITYCLVIGKIGEIKVDQSSSKLQNPQIDWNKLISQTEKTMVFSDRIFVWIKNVINFLSTLKRAILPFF